jgi:methionine-rich copper-binding protein CopC
MTTTKTTATFLATIAASALMLAASQAAAHAKLVSASPAPNATVAAPRAISLKFSEKLEPKFSGFEIVTAAGAAVPVKTTIAKDGLVIDGALAAPLAPGAYKVTWHAVTADAHRMTGDYGFTIR